MEYQKRIILGGLPRSGSTLLKFLIDASSSIICGPETAFFTQPLYHQQSQVHRWAPMLSAKLEIPEEEIKNIILAANTSYEAFDGISDLLAWHAGVHKPCWAEKSPRNCFSYHWLQAENPDFYFISTIRHGLDVVTSIIEDHPKRGNDYWCPIQRYVDTMMAVYSFEHPRHLIIKYEDLVTEPQKTACHIFEFLGLPYEEQVLENFNRPTFTSDFKKVNDPKLRYPIESDRVDRWKKRKYKSRIGEFMKHPKAMYWLEYSGYKY
jgi:hypothetical protein